MPSSIHARIIAVIRAIPRGEVMTYGQVAAAAGVPRGARVVVWALRTASDRVPWHRVVGRAREGWAKISIKDPLGAAQQMKLLRKEGVTFTRSGEIELAPDGPRERRRPPVRRRAP
jgi:methylated-DNA-protein-cysteine methyltransferase-like protein